MSNSIEARAVSLFAAPVDAVASAVQHLTGLLAGTPPDEDAAFVERTLAVIPEPVKGGPYAAEVLARVKVLAVAVRRAGENRTDHQAFRDVDIHAVNEAAAHLTAIAPGFNLGEVDVPDESVKVLVLNVVNSITRLGGVTLHEGVWDGEKWSSWNREVDVYPRRYETPEPPADARSKAETFAPIVAIVRAAPTIRVVGAGHSFNESTSTGGTRARPEGTLLSLDKYDRVARVPRAEAAATFGLPDDRADRVARVQGGTRLRDATHQLWEMGLALPAQGSTDAQSVAGLIATDLHGTGRDHAFLSEQVLELTLVKGDGALVTIQKRDGSWVTDETPPRRFEHLPVTGALGMLGVVVEVVLQLVPAYDLKKDVVYMPREDAERALDDLLAQNDHLSFYYPGGVREVLTVRKNTWNRTSAPPGFAATPERTAHEELDQAAAAFAPGVLDFVGDHDAHTDLLVAALNAGETEILHAPDAFSRQLFYQHDEIEYGVPRENALASLTAVMQLLADEELRSVVEVRFAPDTTVALMGPGTAGRGKGGTCFVELATSTGTYSKERIAEVYAKFEDVMRAYGGRPHLGKKTSVDAAGMAAIYGKDWALFEALRRAWDPEGRFLPPDNAFLNRVFGSRTG
jgi:FAD/FMN-containing dehydrogenase